MKLQLRSRLPDAAVEALVGSQARPEHVTFRLERDATLFKPDGARLLTLRRGAISEDAAARAYPFLHALRRHSTRNRGAYSGMGSKKPFLRADGALSKTSQTAEGIPSVVVGFMDRYPRMPFCRECALSARDPEAWGECLPMIQEVAALFEREIPDRARAQLDAAKATHPAYVIPRTPFTTLTVNNTFAGGYHRDAGDFKPGFGVMAVFRRGHYDGGDLVLPAFGVGVDLADRDVIFFDVHEAHGNVPLVRTGGGGGVDEGERISVVFYFREKMTECLSPAEELSRAKARGALETTEDE